MKKVAFMMIVALFAVTGVAMAKGPGGGGPDTAVGRGGGGGERARAADGTFWERDRIVEALELTEEEQASLMELHETHRAEVQELRDDLQDARDGLQEIMMSEEFSQSKARKAFKDTEKIQTQLREQRFEMELKQRDILGSERYAKLQKVEQRIRKQRRKNS